MSVDAAKMIVTACQIVRAGCEASKLIKDIDKMVDDPEIFRGCSIATRSGLLALNILEIFGLLLGKINPHNKRGETIKACELILRFFDLPIQIGKHTTALIDNPTDQKIIRLIEEGIIAPLAGILRTAAEGTIYQESRYIEEHAKDPSAKRPIPTVDDDGYHIEKFETIDPEKCKNTINACRKIQVATSVVEIAAGLNAAEGFYKLVAKRILFLNVIPGAPPPRVRVRPAPRPPVAAIPNPPPPPQRAVLNLSDSTLEKDLAKKLENSLELYFREVLEKDPILGKNICPITGGPIRILATDKTTNGKGPFYEASALREWVVRRGTSPTTRQPMTVFDIEYPMIPQAEIDKQLANHARHLGPIFKQYAEEYFKKVKTVPSPSKPDDKTPSQSASEILKLLENPSIRFVERLTVSLEENLTVDILEQIARALKKCPKLKELYLIAKEITDQTLKSQIEKVLSKEPKIRLGTEKLNGFSSRPLPKVDNGPTGLTNIGNSCYLNSSLQVIFNHELFRGKIETFRDSDDPLEKNLYALMHVKDPFKTQDLLRIIRGELYNDDEEQDAGECLQALLTALDCNLIKTRTTVDNANPKDEDVSMIPVSIEGKKKFSQALDGFFLASTIEKTSMKQTIKLMNAPELIFVQLKRTHHAKNKDPLEYPDNHIVYLPCGGKDEKYRIVGFINHLGHHYTADVRNFRDPENSRRWIHCDDGEITEQKPVPELDAVVIALEKCKS